MKQGLLITESSKMSPCIKFAAPIVLILAVGIGYYFYSNGENNHYAEEGGNSTKIKKLEGGNYKKAQLDHPLSDVAAKKKFTDKLKEIEVAQGNLSTGIITRLEWENLWAAWAREDWKAAVRGLDLIGQDPYRIKGILAGVSLEQYAEILQFAEANLSEPSLNALGLEAITMYSARKGENILAFAFNLPKAISSSNIGSRLCDALTNFKSKPLSPGDLNSILDYTNGDKQKEVAASLLNYAAINSKLDAPMAIKALAARNDSADIFNSVLETYSRKHPVEAVSLALELPDSSNKGRAAYITFSRWAQDDPENAGVWLNELPPGNYKDFFIAGYVSATKTLNTEASDKWRVTMKNADAINMATRVLPQPVNEKAAD